MLYMWSADICGAGSIPLPLHSTSIITVYMRRLMQSSGGSVMHGLLLISTWKYTVMRVWNPGVQKKGLLVVRRKLIFLLSSSLGFLLLVSSGPTWRWWLTLSLPFLIGLKTVTVITSSSGSYALAKHKHH